MSAPLTVPEEVAVAFALRGEAVPMPGGEGRTFRSGDIVLRRENIGDELGAVYTAELFDTITEDGFRVPRPIRTTSGAWLAAERWTAWTFVEGHAATRDDAPAMLAGIEAFHRATAHLPYPKQIERRDSPYWRADQGAFGTMPAGVRPQLRPILDRLYELRRPVEGLRDQVIHGDANAENVLIADGLPPAIIDLATYWRPPEFALAVSAFWLGPYRDDPAVLRHFEYVREFDQLLLRACIRSLLVMDGFGYVHELDAYRPAIEIVTRRALAVG